MTARKFKVVHYLNQFFGQVGQEEKADLPFMVKKGPVGPGMALQGGSRWHDYLRGQLFC